MYLYAPRTVTFYGNDKNDGVRNDIMRKKRSHDDAPIDFDLFEDLLEDMIDRIEELVGDGSPATYGFSITKRPGEVPEIVEFGSRSEVNEPVLEGYRPLLELFETDDNVHVIIELPGIDKENIRMDATENTLTIQVTIDEQTYSETFDLPARVDPVSAVASYRNGVIDITLVRTGDAKTQIELT